MDYKIELKSIKFLETLSDETICFTANLYVNGKKVGTCKNEGRGGNTSYTHNTGILNDRRIIKDVEEWCKKQQVKTYPTEPNEHVTISWSSLEEMIDDIVINEYNKKQESKINKKFKNLMLKNVMFTTDPLDNITTYDRFPFKGHTIEKVLQSENGRKVIKELIKSEIESGQTLINTNIPKELLP